MTVKFITIKGQGEIARALYRLGRRQDGGVPS